MTKDTKENLLIVLIIFTLIAGCTLAIGMLRSNAAEAYARAREQEITTIAYEAVERALEAKEEPYIEEFVDPDDLEMLACVIYQEAGGDASCDDCRRRVADVVLNRVEDSRFPNTIEEVLTAKNQYGRFHYTGIVWPKRATNPGEAHAVERAYRIAEEVLLGNHSDLYGQGYIWQAEFKQGKDHVYCHGMIFGR